jgi:hypothetical protein
MFEKITDLSFERSWKQAIGFYLVCLLTVTLLALVIGIIDLIYLTSTGILPKSPEALQAGHEFGKKIFPLFAASSTVIALLIIRAKKAYSATALITVFVAAVLSAFTFIFVALIPAACLTTLPKSTPPQGS